MENVHAKTISTNHIISSEMVSQNELCRISDNADAIRAKAMELTDSWEGVMFALSEEELENIALALEFSPDVAGKIHNKLKTLRYAKIQSQAGPSFIVTYHILDVSLLALRGVTCFDNALSHVNDFNLQSILNENQDTFQKIRATLPEHAARMNFKPETAAAVLKALGANISPDLLYELCPKYGTSSVIDLEGRRGVTTEFIRCVTLTLGTTLA
ncbi:hypothetical protein TI10_13805 [Photorhabdus luminescens subsp. luminescens]|uniref:Uncharacterized protein n=1 Tax=Photorhabdus luminescens TaxID=29488 RepID=A0A1G5QEL0_PHOLU|nr:hypothetical protein [Photorhabdus luminescens]KMW72524.1 hypothetical protein TI10_13805 [Photorhabdus luminescens subsp. luminescens]SCZ59940.1 hypothetical protein SAMN02982990_01510 [Photorhabdus luminescens]